MICPNYRQEVSKFLTPEIYEIDHGTVAAILAFFFVSLLHDTNYNAMECIEIKVGRHRRKMAEGLSCKKGADTAQN